MFTYRPFKKKCYSKIEFKLIGFLLSLLGSLGVGSATLHNLISFYLLAFVSDDEINQRCIWYYNEIITRGVSGIIMRLKPEVYLVL